MRIDEPLEAGEKRATSGRSDEFRVVARVSRERTGQSGAAVVMQNGLLSPPARRIEATV